MKIKFMQRAIELARQNITKLYGGPFGAVIVKDGKIIGEGSNEVVKNNDPTAHAEIVAIRRATQYLNSFQLEGCEIYCSCEPCPMCLGAIYWARPSKIYYAASREDASKANFDDSLIYKEINMSLNKRLIPIEQVLPEKAKEVFKEWNEGGIDIVY